MSKSRRGVCVEVPRPGIRGVRPDFAEPVHANKIHSNFVLHHCVEAIERVRNAIALKISLSCQKIYLCCSSILVFLTFGSIF